MRLQYKKKGGLTQEELCQSGKEDEPNAEKEAAGGH